MKTRWFSRLSSYSNIGALFSILVMVVMAYWVPDSLGSYSFGIMLVFFVIFAACLGVRVACSIVQDIGSGPD